MVACFAQVKQIIFDKSVFKFRHDRLLSPAIDIQPQSLHFHNDINDPINMNDSPLCSDHWMNLQALHTLEIEWNYSDVPIDLFPLAMANYCQAPLKRLMIFLHFAPGPQSKSCYNSSPVHLE